MSSSVDQPSERSTDQKQDSPPSRRPDDVQLPEKWVATEPVGAVNVKFMKATWKKTDRCALSSVYVEYKPGQDGVTLTGREKIVVKFQYLSEFAGGKWHTEEKKLSAKNPKASFDAMGWGDKQSPQFRVIVEAPGKEAKVSHPFRYSQQGCVPIKRLPE